MQELDILLLSLDEIISKVSLQSISFPLIFSLYSSVNLSIIIFLHNFYSLNILQYHMIYHILAHNY